MRINTNQFGALKVYFHSSGSLNGSTPRYFYLDSLELENGQHLTNGDLGNLNRLYRDVYRSKSDLAQTIKGAL